ARQSMAIDAAKQTIQFLDWYFRGATWHSPMTRLWLPENQRPLPLRFETPPDCFVAALCCLRQGGAFSTTATAAAWLPEGFTLHDTIAVLDECLWHAGRDNPLVPRHPFRSTLSPAWDESVEKWRNGFKSISLAHAAALVAFDLSAVLDEAQRVGRDDLQ